jgi:hypothetical protein
MDNFVITKIQTVERLNFRAWNLSVILAEQN